MRRMRTAVAVAVLVCAAAAAPAQDADAETRFHRAYEHEVVDGKVADAAREYLAMMEDAKVPERLRQEAKFRFAVTAMLLGRADEARVHFAALAADATAPETLRARAGEYLDAAKGVGVGNEIDKKMQALVFDLARGTTPTDAAYREFEVIGKRAIPFLRQLLQHEDAAIRGHAFIVLCRMRVSGMVDVWNPEITRDGYAAIAFNGYLHDRPDDRAAFERKLLALDDAVFQDAVDTEYIRPAYSADTLRAFAARKLPATTLLAVFPSAWTEETDRVRGEWIQSDDAALSAEATLSYLAFVKSLPEGKIALRTDLFPAIVARLETMPLASMPVYGTGQKVMPTQLAVDGLSRIASLMPAETILDVLAKIVERGAAAPAGDSNPLRSGVVHALASALDRRDPKAELPPRYGEILKTWGAAASKQGYLEWQQFQPHLGNALWRMPTDAATALAVWAVTMPLKGINPRDLANAVPGSRPQDVAVAMAAIRAADGEMRSWLLNQLGPGNSQPTAEYAREYLRVLPELVRMWIASGQNQNWPPVGSFLPLIRTLPADEARDRFTEMAEAVAEVPDVNKRSQSLTVYLLGIPPQNQEDRSAYWTEVALPALDRVWSKLDAVDRRSLLSNILSLLSNGPRNAALRTAIGKFVAARYGEVADGSAPFIAQAPDVFPLTEWVPNVCPDSGVTNNGARVPVERADPAVRALTEDRSAVNAAVLVFLRQSASPAVGREIADRLLRTAPPDRVRLMLIAMDSASTDALEEVLKRTLAQPNPDIGTVGLLVSRLEDRRPSEELLPAIRLLLRSPGYVPSAVQTAKSLGSEALLPDLAGLLDSMNPGVRNLAKDAIDSIVALRKLKEEARRSAGGK